MVQSSDGGVPAPTARAADSPAWDRLGAVGTRLLDGALLLGLVALGLLDVVIGGDTATTPVNPIVVLLVIALVAVRRRWPVGTLAGAGGLLLAIAMRRVTGIGIAAWDPLLAPVAALSILVAPVIRRQPEPIALAAGLFGGAAVVCGLLAPGKVTAVVLAVPIMGTYLIGVIVGLYLRELERRQRAAADHARQHERLDLARELHDLVAHEVAGIVVRAQAAQVVTDRDPTAAGAALDQIELAGKEALTAMRRLVGALRGLGAEPHLGRTAPPGGLGDLRHLVAASEAVGLPVDLVVDPAAGQQVSVAVAASAHRIVQESLTNVRRHARNATRARVALRLQAGELVVTIVDDGLRWTAGRSTPGGYGVIGMRERADALGGTLHAGPISPPAHGWLVRAVLPSGSPDAGAAR